MLDNLKLMLGIAAEDTTLDDKLRLIISNATTRLKTLIGGIDPPETLDYIIFEVAIVRFNKIGSEGFEIHSVEGENITFTNADFKDFEADIQAFLASQKETTRGKVRFI
jgi:hypothetical protein